MMSKSSTFSLFPYLITCRKIVALRALLENMQQSDTNTEDSDEVDENPPFIDEDEAENGEEEDEYDN